MTGENETKTAEVTSRHDNDEASSNVNDTPKSTIAPMNYLRTTGKLPDSNPILNTDTAIVDKIVPSSTPTTLNPSIDFTNVPYLKFAISKTIVNVTTNAANNDTSSTTVSFNISGVVENHAFVNNGLTTPSFKNDVPQPIATKNIQGGDNAMNVFDNPQEVMFESMTSSPSATTVPEIQSVTEFTVTNSSKGLVENLTLTQEAYNETSTTAEVTVQTTPSSVLSEKATVGSVATIPDTVNSNSDSKAETTFDTAVTVSISNNTTTFANEILDSTLSTPAPTVNAGSAVDNSYRTDNSTINQNSDNNALHQNDTGLKLIGESTTTEKIEMSSMTETKFTMTGENETKTAEVTSRHDNDEASSNVNDTPKSTIAPMNYLRTTGKLPDSNPILNTDTAIVDKIVPSSTPTTLNPSIDFTNVPYLKFAISKTIVNVTTNAANNDTSSTTVSFNISGVVENHAFVNNGLTTPSFKNDVPQPIATKNIQGGIMQ
ncbi:uncharacterized protein PB18E9.04c-like [Trichoplusia ni]|uniref:Uncharacterized protein PB18E9.04c-like n=1 Tax=Trichoplusia ni TaxID=7111 RepID=A0A7E5WE35_TRINI|nr:uncharacterized protein PB18E9.04c-like [Trichoplusia ni]